MDRAQRGLWGKLTLSVVLVSLLSGTWQAVARASAGGLVSTAVEAVDAPVVEDAVDVTAAVVDDEIIEQVKKTLPAAQSGANEEADPQPQAGAASATGTAGDVDLLQSDVATAGESSTTSNGDGCSAEATSLEVGDMAVTRAASQCAEGQSTSDEAGLFMESCNATGGQICMALLYAVTGSTSHSGSRSSEADSAVAALCLGGSQDHPTDPCTGVLDADLARSHSESQRNSSGTAASASEWSRVAGLCVGGRNPDTGVCNGIGVEVLHADAAVAAADGEATPTRGSYVLGVQIQGEEARILENPSEVPIPECSEVDALVCAVLNAGESVVGQTGAAARQQSVGAEIEDIAGLSLSDAAAAAGAAGGIAPPKVRPRITGDPNRPPLDAVVLGERHRNSLGSFGQLPFTGSTLIVLFLAGIALAAAGIAALRTE